MMTVTLVSEKCNTFTELSGLLCISNLNGVHDTLFKIWRCRVGFDGFYAINFTRFFINFVIYQISKCAANICSKSNFRHLFFLSDTIELETNKRVITAYFITSMYSTDTPTRTGGTVLSGILCFLSIKEIQNIIIYARFCR